MTKNDQSLNEIINLVIFGVVAAIVWVVGGAVVSFIVGLTLVVLIASGN